MAKQVQQAPAMLRYALLQLPAVALLLVIAILLQRWLDLPRWFAWGLIALWVAKDVILFPFVRGSYDQSQQRDTNVMVGATGVTKDRLDPSGYVEVRGELWQAEVLPGTRPIDEGEDVRIRRIRGLTLLVERDQVNHAKVPGLVKKNNRR